MEHNGHAYSSIHTMYCRMHIRTMKSCYHVNLIVQVVINGDLCNHRSTTISKNSSQTIVERYLDAKYYHYDPEELYEMCEYNNNAKYLAESDQIVTLTSSETDEYSVQASLNDISLTLFQNGRRRPRSRTSPIRTPYQGSRMSSVYGGSR